MLREAGEKRRAIGGIYQVGRFYVDLEGMEPTPVFLLGKIPWTVEPGYSPGVLKSRTRFKPTFMH